MSHTNTLLNVRRLLSAFIKEAALSATLQTYSVEDQNQIGVLIISKYNKTKGLLIEQDKVTNKVGLYFVRLHYDSENKTYGYESLIKIEEEFDKKLDILFSPLDLFANILIEMSTQFMFEASEASE